MERVRLAICIRSLKDSVDDTAQQLPQSDWSRMKETDLAHGKAADALNVAGSAAAHLASQCGTEGRRAWRAASRLVPMRRRTLSTVAPTKREFTPGVHVLAFLATSAMKACGCEGRAGRR